jgi:ABC-type sugar transport system substrate-binding protein
LKKIVVRAGAFAVGVGLVAALAGCSAGAPPTTASSGASRLKTVTFVNPLPDYPAWKVIGQCMSEEARKKGLTFTQSGQTGSSVDATYMANRIEQAIAEKINAIITFPTDADQFDPLFTQAKNAGILTETVESGAPTTNDLNVGTSYEEYGALAAETIAKKGGTQYIGLISAAAADNPFVIGFSNWLKAHPKSPVKLLDSQFDNADPTLDTGLVEAMLVAHPQINMFLTNEGAATSPIVSVLKQKNLKGKVFLTTNSIYSGSIQGMQDGYVYAFLLQDMCGIGTSAIDSLVSYANGTLSNTNVATKILFATKGNYKKLTASGEYQ